jgi:hypothetical protein
VCPKVFKVFLIFIQSVIILSIGSVLFAMAYKPQQQPEPSPQNPTPCNATDESPPDIPVT